MAQRETGTARNGDVWLERGVRRKDGGVTVEYTIGGVDAETTVRVREPIDEGVTLAEAGFHPEHEPAEWTLEEGALSFETTVPADGSFETVFGAVADEPFLAGDPELERLDSGSGGLFASVRGIFGGRENNTEASGDATATPGERSETGLDTEGMLGGDTPAEGEDADGGGEAESNDETLVPNAETDSESETDVEGGSDGEPEAAPPEERTSERSDTAPDGDATASDDDTPDTGSDSVDDTATDPGGDDAPAGPGTSDTPTESTPVNPTETAEALVELVEEDDALRESLREALDAGDSEPAESVDTRLRHVQGRVDDLAAYTGALEESIDEHGRPAEAFADLQAETTALREEVAEVRAGVDEVRSEQDSLAERMDDLAAETETLRAEFAEAGERREARLNRLESDVDGVATDLRHARDGMESDLEAVREDVSELQSMRESLSAAFGEVAGGEEQSADGERAEVAGAESEAEAEHPE